MSVRVRPAALADVDAIVAIEDAAFPGDKLDRRAFRRAVRSPSVLAQVAEREGAVLGYVLVETRRGSTLGRLTSVAVAPGAGGAGIGRALVEAAEAATRAAGRDRMRLEVRADNARAVALYERAGYRRLATVEDYYEDGEAAVRFEKALGPSAHPGESRGPGS